MRRSVASKAAMSRNWLPLSLVPGCRRRLIAFFKKHRDGQESDNKPYRAQEEGRLSDARQDVGTGPVTDCVTGAAIMIQEVFFAPFLTLEATQKAFSSNVSHLHWWTEYARVRAYKSSRISPGEGRVTGQTAAPGTVEQENTVDGSKKICRRVRSLLMKASHHLKDRPS
jgi:hypothetical protein